MAKRRYKTPFIRFPEFKNTWEQFELGEMILKTERRNKQNLNLPVYSINNTAGFVPQDEQFEGRNSKERGFDISIYKIVGKKTFAYNPARINVGSIGYSNELDNVLVSSLYVCFMTNERLDDKFLLHFLGSNSFKVSVLSIQEGGVRQYLFFQNLSKINIFTPTIPEQKRIASFFTVLEKKINELKRKKNLLEQYKKGVMHQLFSQELKFKDDYGKEFPKWEQKQLGKVVEINPRSERLPETFIYIDLESVVQRRLTKEDRINKSEAPSRAQRLLIKNDILFQMVRPYQKNNYFFNRDEKDFVASTGYAQIRTIGNAEFLFQYLHEETFVTKVIEKCTGTGYPAINSTALSNIIISIPSEKEQNKIANFLSAIDIKIDSTTTQIQQTERYKKGLLQNMFI